MQMASYQRIYLLLSVTLYTRYNTPCTSQEHALGK